MSDKCGDTGTVTPSFCCYPELCVPPSVPYRPSRHSSTGVLLIPEQFPTLMVITIKVTYAYRCWFDSIIEKSRFVYCMYTMCVLYVYCVCTVRTLCVCVLCVYSIQCTACYQMCLCFSKPEWVYLCIILYVCVCALTCE